jgi:hypothetical protein
MPEEPTGTIVMFFSKQGLAVNIDSKNLISEQ